MPIFWDNVEKTEKVNEKKIGFATLFTLKDFFIFSKRILTRGMKTDLVFRFFRNISGLFLNQKIWIIKNDQTIETFRILINFVPGLNFLISEKSYFLDNLIF